MAVDSCHIGVTLCKWVYRLQTPPEIGERGCRPRLPNSKHGELVTCEPFPTPMGFHRQNEARPPPEQYNMVVGGGGGVMA